MKQIIFKKHESKITFSDLEKIGIQPRCYVCTNSSPTGSLSLECNHSNKIIDLFSNENLYTDKCEHFKTDLNGIQTIAEEYKIKITIKSKNRIYTFG